MLPDSARSIQHGHCLSIRVDNILKFCMFLADNVDGQVFITLLEGAQGQIKSSDSIAYKHRLQDRYFFFFLNRVTCNC